MLIKLTDGSYINTQYVTFVKLHKNNNSSTVFFLGEKDGSSFTYESGVKICRACGVPEDEIE